jgi:crotonobetainyl-CoA:carnitine CoA-transferase CaiB-like acyl-CoA transferase
VPHGPLAGLRVLDLSRVLAGPWASQILGDLGADVIKIESPGVGDDTRHWGPPFLDDGSHDSAYYAACNRNKRSVAVDLSLPEGAAIARAIAMQSDIVLENFRVGALLKFGLDYESLRQQRASLIYCSVTGFGQDGPYRDRGGYDFLIQGMSGLMSVTGRRADEPGAGPLKVGIPISDLSTGLYAAVSILAALHHRNATGEGQYIDCALFDTQLALLANQASSYLNGGGLPRALGNQHPVVVPYQDFETADGSVLVAVGNDRQFRGLCRLLKRADLADDPRFLRSADRNTNRQPLLSELQRTIRTWTSAELLRAMDEAKLPGGPVNNIAQALEDPQVSARGLRQKLRRARGAEVSFLGFPARLSRTPPNYRLAPPRLGEDTNAVLMELLNMTSEDLARLTAGGVIKDGSLAGAR